MCAERTRVAADRAPQLVAVVYLAVEDECVAAARGDHRLIRSRRKILDSQPRERQHATLSRRHPRPITVRTAMPLRGVHLPGNREQ